MIVEALAAASACEIWDVDVRRGKRPTALPFASI